MDRTVKIQIAAELGTGKTTIAQAIKEALNLYGINVKINDTDDMDGVGHLTERLKMIAPEINVVIDVIQLRASLSEKPEVPETKPAIRTVGALRELLKHSDDEESLVLVYEFDTAFGKHRKYLECGGASSSGGGRITVLWFDGKSD